MAEPLQSNLGRPYVDVIYGSPVHSPAGDEATLSAVRDCLSLCQGLVTVHGGSVVKTNADGAMYSFPDADSAVTAAREMQVRLQQHQAKETHDVAIRIGLHFGLPITAGVAAQRVALLAGSGEIFTTGETLAGLSAPQRDAIRQRVLPSRSKQEHVTVYEVLWQTNRHHSALPDEKTTVIQKRGVASLRLIHLGRETLVTNKITIGRRAGNDIQLKDPLVSRDHAYIERRQGKFVLVDLSSHGTLVSPENGEEFMLQRGEMILQGSGVLSFAHGAGRKGPEIVGFRCETY